MGALQDTFQRRSLFQRAYDAMTMTGHTGMLALCIDLQSDLS